MIYLRAKKKLLGSKGEFWLDVELKIEDGITVIFGPSGSGKTTILRILAGLEKPDEGFLEVDGEIWMDTKRGIYLPPYRRRVGFVFQEDTLFPHLTVMENILFGMDKKDKGRALQLLRKVNMEPLKDSYPYQLSGGQRQRVALLRAIARDPRIMLLDEPFSALDENMRSFLQEEVKALQRQISIPMLMVTHSVEEVFKMADRVYIIENGRIIKEGTPHEVFLPTQVSARMSFVATVLDVKEQGNLQLVTIKSDMGISQILCRDLSLKVGDKIMVYVKAFSPSVEKNS
ncbi:ABC transporter related protein [Thermocrinis albus DSM 14484]|uniref:ABC transporter related protein n=1 Tax=Thermocrinis albus (strain DSM 14484 / JCM 11386 / HI 11/12) TaxID=638303 RepID=D3SNC2_THEAH|nr:ATP-binding cassette domain-containing protein [Thermocrinis albus]ADC88659.1 ABC transporter related protein [Thermocrinis albus DSM 14484]